VEHSPFEENLVERVLDIAQELGYPSLRMISGAGHDASYMNLVAPTAMIFVPSIGGRSHVEVENTSWEDCEAGANVLLHCILKSANET
jgi:N-carbamoyl-L-amino-acid hydrolase